MCWSIKEARQKINVYAHEKRDVLELAYSKHAMNRCMLRDISISDVLYVLAYGSIDEEPEESTRPDYCKYKICNKTPNSGNREICVVVIPDPDRPAIKIITAMWRDLR